MSEADNKYYFKPSGDETKDSFINYFNQENNKTGEEYINLKSESMKNGKEDNLVHPLSKILFEAKQKAIQAEAEKNADNGMQV